MPFFESANGSGGHGRIERHEPPIAMHGEPEQERIGDLSRTMHAREIEALLVEQAELGIGLVRIDLSRVVSKWLGETEKNLGAILDAAESGCFAVLFDEADALFGKRTSDTKSSNDRYANLEVNFLLQRLERFGGLSILTTNLSKAIDPAFRRRFAYDVQFSFPTLEMREELWARAIPPRAPARRPGTRRSSCMRCSPAV